MLQVKSIRMANVPNNQPDSSGEDHSILNVSVLGAIEFLR